KTLEFRNGSNNECIDIFKKKIETLKQGKEGVDGKLAGLLTTSKNLDNLIESQRPPPTVESTSGDDQNINPYVSETVATPITPKPFIKFVKPKDSQSKSKIDETETPKKPSVKYAEQYRKPNKKPNVKGNQRNWNNLKSQQLGSKVEELAPKALMVIDRVGWDWSFMENEEENHALVADEESPAEFTLMAKFDTDNELFDNSLCSKACKKNTDSLNS
nr:hypothetical protein [Tanacetum cinerariifolium]